jgi:RNA polymerase sigma factor (sigma-70 family)
LDINSLHRDSCGKEKAAEEKLFAALTVRFRLFAGQKILDKQDAEEVVQKSLMIVFQKYRGIDFKTSFAAWAHKVLDNEILKHYRAKSTREGLFVGTADGGAPTALWNPDPELKRRLVGCMTKLLETNHRYARILDLHYQGYSAEEICREITLTLNNFYVLLSRARSALRHCLDNEGIS